MTGCVTTSYLSHKFYLGTACPYVSHQHHIKMETSELKETIRHPSMDLLPESEGHHRYEIFLQKFAVIVNYRKKNRRITDDQVSKASGLSRQTINSLRNKTGGKVPTLESAIRLLTTLGYEVQIKELPHDYKLKQKRIAH